MKTLIKNITLYTGERLINDGCLIVEDAKIVYSGEVDAAPKNLEVSKTIDGEGGICMPGFNNAHAHAAMTLVRGVGSDLVLQDWLSEVWKIEDNLTAEHVYRGTMLAIMEMVRRGITSFADQYFFMDEAARAVEETGVRANLSRGITAGVGDDDGGRLQDNLNLFKNWHGQCEGRIRVSLAPHAEYTTTPALLKRIVEAGHRVGAGIHIHISETQREVDECVQRHGQSPVQYLNALGMFDLPVIGAHCVVVDDSDIQVLARKKVHVVHNPASNLKLASGICPVATMLEAGIDVALGSDGVASNNSHDMFADMKLAALIQKGFYKNVTALTAEQALHMATRAGALAMGFDEVGLLEAGMEADLLILEKNAANMIPAHDITANLVYSAQGLNVKTTMVAGKVLYHDGEYKTLDAERVIYEAKQAATELGS